MRAVFDGGYAGSRKRMKTVMDRDRRLVCTMGFVGGFTWPTGPPTSPDRLRRQRARAAARRRRCPRGRKREGEPHPQDDVGRLRPGGLPVPGPAAGTARAARSEVELAFRPAELPPGSVASSARATSRRAARRILVRTRRSWCPPPSIPWPRSDRVTGACHMIVAPPVARVAAEHGLADSGADARSARPCGSTGTFLAIRQTRLSDAPNGAPRPVR